MRGAGGPLLIPISATDVRGAAHACGSLRRLAWVPFQPDDQFIQVLRGCSVLCDVGTGIFRLAFCGTHHFRLDRVIELNPCLLHLWSKCGTKLLLQAPYQCLTERSEMRCLYSEVRVLPSCMTDDGLE